jgi:hypothetical protein
MRLKPIMAYLKVLPLKEAGLLQIWRVRACHVLWALISLICPMFVVEKVVKLTS